MANKEIIYVATYAPMKRGLKARQGKRFSFRRTSSNLCPDEKGTESRDKPHARRQPHIVATYAPMKRGLKVVPTSLLYVQSLSSNLCPDEKGTESENFIMKEILIASSNLCPDEKGTESKLEIY